MFAAAAAAAASSGQRSNSSRFAGHANIFSKRPSGLESPPQSLENRSTPGSLDLSRTKDDYLEDCDSSDLPPTMVKMEAMVYPKMDSEDEDEGQTRLEKRIFDDDEDQDAEDLSSKRPKLDQTGENNNEKNAELVNSCSDELQEQDGNSLKVKDEFKEKQQQEEQETN